MPVAPHASVRHWVLMASKTLKASQLSAKCRFPCRGCPGETSRRLSDQHLTALAHTARGRRLGVSQASLTEGFCVSVQHRLRCRVDRVDEDAYVFRRELFLDIPTDDHIQQLIGLQVDLSGSERREVWWAKRAIGDGLALEMSPHLQRSWRGNISL